MNNTKKKIVHITQTLERGGAERLITELSVLSAKQYSVTVICQYNEIADEFKQMLENSGVTLIMLSKKKGFSISAMIELYKVLSNIKPDIIHTHIQSSVYAFLYYVFHRKVKKVHTIHTLPQTEFTRLHMLVQFMEYKLLNVVPVAVSNTVKSETEKVYHMSGDKVKCVYNGIDTHFFQPSARKKSNGFTLINVANFSVWKRQCDIINAIALLNDDTQCIFAGDGKLKTETENLAKNLGIYNKCRFLGKLTSREDVKTYLNKADAFILTSEFEGTPISVIEAYACGLPIIATDVGGMRDILDDGINGILCKKGDIHDIANKIKLLRDNPNLRLKISSANLKKSKDFDIRTTYEKYFEIYEE